MATTATSPFSASSRPQAVPNAALTAGFLLAAWLLLVVVLGAKGGFVAPDGAPPLPLLAGVLVPLLVFFGLFRLSRSFHDLVLAADVRVLTGVQAWRFAGFGFIALYAYRVLPGAFAWPAGLGDMAIGLTAPFMAAALVRRPGFVAGRGFIVWNLLGLLDLVTALGTGALSAIHAGGLPVEATIRPMTRLPLLLVPGYLVPIFIMLHAVALIQARAGTTPTGAST